MNIVNFFRDRAKRKELHKLLDTIEELDISIDMVRDITGEGSEALGKRRESALHRKHQLERELGIEPDNLVTRFVNK
jgi:hypothetical protein